MSPAQGGLSETLEQTRKSVVEDVHPTVTGTVDLPPFYQDANKMFFRKAQDRDKENRHLWINHTSGLNITLKLEKGWKPVEGDEILKTLGVFPLRSSNGRARYGDLELWRRPNAVSERVRRHGEAQLAKRSAGLRATLEAMAAETAGKTRGAVRPFVDSGTPEDVLTKVPIKRS